jgi:DnaA-homolog protein
LSQLALPLTLRDHGVFESFWAANNEALVSHLRNLTDTRSGAGCWIWGGEATGKTHLLQAVCDRFGDESVYLPLDLFIATGPAILDDIASRRCVCLDNINALAADESWETALFGLLNEIADRDALLVVAARAAPRESGFVLPDLQSRLTRLPVFHIEPLDEPDRIRALQLRASHRGLELPGDTAGFLLSRSRRDMASLYGLLDRLDAEALKAQRRLTIPFVRNVLLDRDK